MPHNNEDAEDPGDQEKLELQNLLGKLHGSYRAMAALYCIWGFTLKEIGACFGVSESRICQRLSEVRRYNGQPPKKKKEPKKNLTHEKYYSGRIPGTNKLLEVLKIPVRRSGRIIWVTVTNMGDKK